MTKRTLAAVAGAALAALSVAGCQSWPSAQPRFEQAPTMERTPTVVVKSVTRAVTETAPIPYPTRTVNDPKTETGERHVLTAGAPGLRTLTYLVTVTGDRSTGRKLLRSAVTKKPVTMVVAVGTRVAGTGACNANYSGCVPIAVDVDCAGGGNGPVYVHGPFTVLGLDIYHLDLDGDGRACAGPEDIP